MTPRASIPSLRPGLSVVPKRSWLRVLCFLGVVGLGLGLVTALPDAAAASSPAPSQALAAPPGFTPLFPTDGVPPGWSVRSWNDVSLPAQPNARWLVAESTLRGSVPRGTWLVSPREYSDFTLELEFRLGEGGHGGVGLRFPMRGNPAEEGIVVQMVDPRAFGTNYTAQPWETTGALYKAVPPIAQAFKPLEWNRYSIECRGSHILVTLNGTKVMDADLQRMIENVEPIRGKPLAERPVRGRIGFLEVSRRTGQVEIRNAHIREHTEPR